MLTTLPTKHQTSSHNWTPPTTHCSPIRPPVTQQKKLHHGDRSEKMNLPLTTEARQRQAQGITFKSTHQNFWKYQTKTSATLLTAQKHYPAATEQMLFKSVVNWTSTSLSSLKCKSSLNPTTTHSFMAALHISMSLDPTTTHSFVAALHISMSLDPTTTHSFMAALHISTVVFQRLFQSCF